MTRFRRRLTKEIDRGEHCKRHRRLDRGRRLSKEANVRDGIAACGKE
jgi:hypothetical protein